MLREGAVRRFDWPPQYGLWPINFPFLFVGRSSLPALCPGTRGFSALRSFQGPLDAERGGSCRDRSYLLRRSGSAGTCRGSHPSLLKWTEDVCLWAGVSLGNMTVILFSKHIGTLPLPALQTPVPPGCPWTGLEPLSLGGAARWSSRAPPPLVFQGVDWLPVQPIPHHAPWESS